MKKDGGFTLVEVLVSVVLLAILGTVFFQFFIFSQDTASSNEGKMDAVTIAQSVLEDIKNGIYPEVTKKTHASYPVIFQNHESSPGPVCTWPDIEEFDDESGKDCESRYTRTVNKGIYHIEIELGGELDSGLRLHSIEVRVFNGDGKLQSSVRGAVKL